MPERRDQETLARESAELVQEGRNLRQLSDRLLEEIQALRDLETRAREMPIGSPEFEELSREITDRARGVFRLTAEQEALGVQARFQEDSIEDQPDPDPDSDR